MCKRGLLQCVTLYFFWDLQKGRSTAETMSVPHFEGIPADVPSSISVQNKLSLNSSSSLQNGSFKPISHNGAVSHASLSNSSSSLREEQKQS